MSASAKEISKAFERISDVCFSIKESGACDECPMKYVCLEDESAITLADLICSDTWQEFLDYEDKAAEKCSRDNAVNEYWDNKRKADIEERWIDANE
jgi:hypothetical protein